MSVPDQHHGSGDLDAVYTVRCLFGRQPHEEHRSVVSPASVAQLVNMKSIDIAHVIDMEEWRRKPGTSESECALKPMRHLTLRNNT